ncbi:MAG: class I SAM-dependent methyltransferase [Nitrospirota bacterium]|nr:class I SAM-dependent methyltransferase [Nitrospirota bacterium]
MKGTICKRAATVKFWDSYSKWYKLWMEHNNYHDRIIEVLTTMVEPGWKVLDIGAGNGVLSLPPCAIGCDVTALEPSIGMRNLLFEEAFKRGIDWINVNERRWEDMPFHQLKGYDLIMACNSLHLTQMGFGEAVEKIFQANPKYVFVITELGPQEIKVKWHYSNHTMAFSKCYEAESSFAYHSMNESFEHWAFKKGRRPYPDEEIDIKAQLIFEDGHFWMKDAAYVGMYWWKRKDEICF